MCSSDGETINAHKILVVKPLGITRSLILNGSFELSCEDGRCVELVWDPVIYRYFVFSVLKRRIILP
jgi:hypothetical protein